MNLRRSTLLLLAGAVVLAILALIVAKMAGSTHSAPPKLSTRAAVVANVPFALGDMITPEKLAVVQMPADAVPAGSFSSIPAVAAGGTRVAQRPIMAREIITPAAISGSGSRLSNLGVIGPSMRAIAVSVTEHTGVGGLVAPGDRVDVFVTRTPPEKGGHTEATMSADALTAMATTAAGGGRAMASGARLPVPDNADRPGPHTFVPKSAGNRAGLRVVQAAGDKPQPITDLLVQDARVLAVGQIVNTAAPKIDLVKTATLEVTPLDAAKLTLGEQAGTLTLVLRGVADSSRAALGSLRTDDLHDGLPRPIIQTSRPRARRAGTARPSGPSVEVVRSGSASSYVVPS